MLIRRLTPKDAVAFQALRLEALQASPTAFGSSFEEEKESPISAIEGRLAIKNDRGSFGAFKDEELIGFAALGRESLSKLSHKAFVWGMYVKPIHRDKGIAKSLLHEVLSLAHSVPEVLQVNLSVNASNSSAIRLYESFGFKLFGREPNAIYVNGELHDEMHMYLHLGSA